MPKLKQSLEQSTASRLMQNIDIRKRIYDMTDERFAIALHMTPPTLCSRRKNPERFTVQEITRAAEVLRTTPQALLFGKVKWDVPQIEE